MYKNTHLQVTQSDPDSQTDPYQVHNTWIGCNSAPSRGRNTGFAIRRVGEQFRMCWFRSSVCPSRNNRRTKPGCRPYLSSHAGCRFGRSGSSGFAGGFHRLRLSNYGLSPRGRSCRIRSGTPVRRERRFSKGRLKNRNRVHTAYTLRQDWRFCAGYGLLIIKHSFFY